VFAEWQFAAEKHKCSCCCVVQVCARPGVCTDLCAALFSAWFDDFQCVSGCQVCGRTAVASHVDDDPTFGSASAQPDVGCASDTDS
jgi:hypothetical protein